MIKALFEIYKKKVVVIAIFIVVQFVASCREGLSYSQTLTKSVEEKRKGNYKLALSYINDAIKSDSDRPFAYLTRGQIKALLKNDRAAIPDFDHALEIEPTLVAGYFYRGISFSNIDSFDLALSDFEKALKLKESDGFIIDYINNENIPLESQTDVSRVEIEFYRGIALLLSNKHSEAKSSFLFSLANGFEVAWSEYYLGVTYIQMNDIEKGCIYLQKAKAKGLKGVQELIIEYCIGR